MATTIRLRRDSAENWTSNNPILALGEPGVETDTKKIKIGNGVNDWRNLAYIEYPLPVATGTSFGTVRPDGTTITINAGVLTAVGGGGESGGGSGTVNSGTSGCLAFYPNVGTTIDDAQGLLWDSLTNVFTVNGTLNATTISGSLNVSNLTGTISSSLLPTATTSNIGAVKIDGSSIVISNGVISTVLPVASTTVSGTVKVDGTTITINNGVITAAGGGGGGSGTVNTGGASRLAYYPSSSNVVDDIVGVTWNDLTNILTVSGTLSATTITGSINASNITGTLASTVLPLATTVAIGGVRADGVTITVNNGIISAVAPVNISGNAATVTNGVYTTGSYANPSWITSLDGTKITNAVLTSGSYANPSWITNLDGAKVLNAVLVTEAYVNPSWIVSLAGNKLTGTVTATNGVVTTGSYADPSWITSLNANKLTGTVTATNGVVTTDSYADPSWITSLNANKLTGTVTATNGVVTTDSYADPSWITSLASSKITTPGSFSITSTGSSTARTLASRFSDFVNVRDFGAVGNGSTDDTIAIQTAIDSLTTGGTVYFPTGRYFVATNLFVRPGVALKGPYENFGMIGNNVPGLTNIGATMSALILSTVATIHLHGGCELSGMFIHRLGMDFTEGTNSLFAGLAIRIAGSSPTIAFASATANGSTITVNYTGASNQFVVGSYAVVGTRPSSDFAGIYKVTSVTSSSFTAASTANGTWSGNNASISRSADDVKITNCLIVGFEQAIEAILAPRLVIRDVKIDCNTGINIENSYDVVKLDNIHCWPFATIGAQALGYTGTNWWFRNGYGIRNWTSDATHITNCFVFGYFFGFWITGNGTSLVNCGVDSVAGAGLVNTGYLFDETNLITQVSNCYAWAYPVGYLVKGASSVVSFSNCSTNGIATYGFSIEAGTANIIGGQSYGSGGTAIVRTGGTANVFGHAVKSTMTATSGTINTISTATTSFVS